jgi:hypothetical protein
MNLLLGKHDRRRARCRTTWPGPGAPVWAGRCLRGLDDGQLEARLFVSAGPPQTVRPLPDWAEIHREVRRPDVTLQLLHLEYKERAPEGYQYSQFCLVYRRWQRHLDAVMRQEHRAGEKLLVDFAGRTLPIIDPRPARSPGRSCSWRCWEPATTRTPRWCRPRSCRTGSPVTCTPSSSSTVSLRSWSRIMWHAT